MLRPKRTRVTLRCATCALAFEVRASDADTRKYCSTGCFWEAERRIRAGQRLPDRGVVMLTCSACGATFPRKAARLAPGSRRRFCSITCHAAAMRGLSDAQSRIWRHIERRGPDACWPWTASVDARGYGQVKDRHRTRKAHQVVLEMVLGRPLRTRDGEWGLHHCDNPPCCNPSHLYAGTARENRRDMLERGRGRHGGAPGSRNSNAKLTETTVRIIRAIMAADPPRGTGATLARLYGVTPTVITRIARGRIWRHVT